MESAADVLRAALILSPRHANIVLRDRQIGDSGMFFFQQALHALPVTSSVGQITIDNPGVTHNSINHLASAIRSQACHDLTNVRLIRWPLKGWADSAVLCRQLLALQRLRVLALERCSAGCSALISLAALVHSGTLEHLVVSHNVLGNGSEIPPKFPPLPLYASQVSPSSTASAIPAEMRAQEATHPSMSHTDELVLGLMQVFAGHWTLPATIAGMAMGRPALTFGSAIASPYCRLTRLDVSFTSMSDELGVALAQAVATNSSLTFLDISHNLLTGTFATVIAQALGTNTTLRELRTGFQPLGLEGVRALLQSLRVNQTVSMLCVENCLSVNSPADLTASFFEKSTRGAAASRNSATKSRAAHAPPQPAGQKIPAPPGRPPSAKSVPKSPRGSSRGSSGGRKDSARKKSPSSSSSRSTPVVPFIATVAAAAASQATADLMGDQLWMLSERVVAARSIFCRIVLEQPERPRGAYRILSRLQALDGEPFGDIDALLNREAKKQKDSWLFLGGPLVGAYGASNGSLGSRDFLKVWGPGDSVWKNRPAESDSKSWYDTDMLMDRAFEVDWGCTKLHRVLTSVRERAAIKTLLKLAYPLLREGFKYFSAISGAPFAMAFTQWVDFRKTLGFDIPGRNAEVDMAFYATQLGYASHVGLMKQVEGPDGVLIRNDDAPAHTMDSLYGAPGRGVDDLAFTPAAGRQRALSGASATSPTRLSTSARRLSIDPSDSEDGGRTPAAKQRTVAASPPPPTPLPSPRRSLDNVKGSGAIAQALSTGVVAMTPAQAIMVSDLPRQHLIQTRVGRGPPPALIHNPPNCLLRHELIEAFVRVALVFFGATPLQHPRLRRTRSRRIAGSAARAMRSRSPGSPTRRARNSSENFGDSDGADEDDGRAFSFSPRDAASGADDPDGLGPGGDGWASGVDSDDVSSSPAVCAVERAIHEHLTPVMVLIFRMPPGDFETPYSNLFRRDAMYTPDVDEVMRRFDSVCRKVFTKYVSSETGFIMLDAWLAFLTGLGVFDGAMQARSGVRPPTAAEVFSGARSSSPLSRLVSPQSAVGGRKPSASSPSRPGRLPVIPSDSDPLKPTAPSRGSRGSGAQAVSRTARMRAAQVAKPPVSSAAQVSALTRDGIPQLQLPPGDEDLTDELLDAMATPVAFSSLDHTNHRVTSGLTAAAAAAAAAAAYAELDSARKEFTERDARHVMLFSIMTVTDEVNRSARNCRVNTHLGMTYLSFLEALCRLAASQGCPPGLPLSVIASDAAAAEASLQKKPTSAASGVSRVKKRASSASKSDAGRAVSPSSAARARTPFDLGRGGAFGTWDRPEAPADLPSRIELLLVHVGVVEKFNIANCRREVVSAAVT